MGSFIGDESDRKAHEMIDEQEIGVRNMINVSLRENTHDILLVIQHGEVANPMLIHEVGRSRERRAHSCGDQFFGHQTFDGAHKALRFRHSAPNPPIRRGQS
jgi:hypothetical protein